MEVLQLKNSKLLKLNIIKSTKYLPLLLLLILMYLIHQYVFLYADDLYYSRDSQIGISYLPYFMINELNSNGRIWVHVLLFFLVKYDVLLFRIINPIIITLTAYLIIKISINKSKHNFFVTSVFTCILFLLLHVDITSITIYYAACSLNYLYSLLLSLLFGYLLYNDYFSNKINYRTKWWLIIISFFAGSSTQQSGMIAIGFATLITLYFLLKKNKFPKGFIPYYLSLILGYSLVTYGSIKRLLFETDTGHAANIHDSVIGLLRTNIFSKPVAIFVILVTISCILWLLYFSVNSTNNFKYQSIINFVLSFILALSLLAYLYLIIYKKLDISTFLTTSATIKIKLFLFGFTMIYLLSLLYISWLIMIKKDYPFMLFCIINAIGAQIMLLVTDPRFANTYKIAFPSLLLIFVFISYSFLNLYKENKFLWFIILIPLLLLSYRYFTNNFNGYKNTSYEINYNINSIKTYRNNTDKSVLTLKKVPPTIYGYNVGNWNSMPYFMKQCYKIDENTIIQYID